MRPHENAATTVTLTMLKTGDSLMIRVMGSKVVAAECTEA